MPRTVQVREDTRQRWVRNKDLAEYFGVSEVTINNWQKDASLGFPQPCEINGKPYTDLDAIDAWMKRRVRRGGA